MGSTPFDTTAATDSTPAFTCSNGAADLWFAFTPATSGTYAIGTCGSSFDTVLELYSGPCGSLLSVACSDDDCGLGSRVVTPLTGGTAYSVRVGGFNGGSGTGELVIDAAPATDDCFDAEIVDWVGAGTFVYDNSAASAGTEGQNETACDSNGVTGIDADVWVIWVADRNGTVTMKTCASDWDTKIAAYTGTNCPQDGSAVACNDDACGLQSEISFAVTFGQCFLLQLGVAPGAVGGSSELSVSFVDAPGSPVLNLDECTDADTDVQIGSGVYAVDTTNATRSAEGQLEDTCYFFGATGIESDIWFLWRATTPGAVTVATCGSTGTATDTKIAVYPINPATGPCPADGTSLACNDDGCGTLSSLRFEAGIGEPYLIQIGAFPGAAGGTLDVVITETGVVASDVGTNYCVANANSTGQPGSIRAIGSDVVTSNELYLVAEGLPCQEFGYFVAASDQGFIANPSGSAGNFCLGGSSVLIGRYNEQLRSSGSFGTFSLRVNVDRVPIGTGTPPERALMPGETWYFQCWYRDSHNGIVDNNFTDGTSILFQ